MGLAVRFIPRKDALEKMAKSYPDFKPYYIEALQAVFHLSSDLEKAIDHHFTTRCNFSRARYLILMVLLHCEDCKMTPNEIAKKLNVTRGNMTGLVDGLIEDGFVTKIQDKEDRRQVWIEVTPKARKFLEKILPDYFKRMAKFMSVMKKEEIETLIELSRKLQTGLSAFED
jgi:DNA-binding MarR family transcriptional regulator